MIKSIIFVGSTWNWPHFHQFQPRKWLLGPFIPVQDLHNDGREGYRRGHLRYLINRSIQWVTMAGAGFLPKEQVVNPKIFPKHATKKKTIAKPFFTRQTQQELLFLVKLPWHYPQKKQSADFLEHPFIQHCPNTSSQDHHWGWFPGSS